MFKSLSAGIIVALAFPLGWLLLWLLGLVSLGLPVREDMAVGLGAVAGRMAEMLVLGSSRPYYSFGFVYFSFQESVAVAKSRFHSKSYGVGFQSNSLC